MRQNIESSRFRARYSLVKLGNNNRHIYFLADEMTPTSSKKVPSYTANEITPISPALMVLGKVQRARICPGAWDL